jgi:hypothetical protein
LAATVGDGATDADAAGDVEADVAGDTEADADADAAGWGGGGGGAGRTALFGVPSTAPSAVLNTGFGAGTSPSAAAFAARVLGADSFANARANACA